MENPTVKRLLARLKQLRLQRGLSQEQFSEQSGISYKYYQAVEAGRKQDLRLSTLVRLAKAHGLEVWQLLMPVSETTEKTRSRATASKVPKSKGN